MGRHSIRGALSGFPLNVAGKDDPRKPKKHRKPDRLMITAPGTTTEIPDNPVRYEGWMDHWDPWKDLERVLNQDEMRRRRQEREGER